MDANIKSTTEIVEVEDIDGRLHRCRVWEGVTAGGVRFTAYISVVQVDREHDNAQFEVELQEHKRPTAETQRAIDLRMIL